MYQLLTKSWSKFPMVGSSVISSPFGTRFSCIHFDKKKLCVSYILPIFLLNDSVLLQVNQYYGSVVVLLLKVLKWMTNSASLLRFYFHMLMFILSLLLQCLLERPANYPHQSCVDSGSVACVWLLHSWGLKIWRYVHDNTIYGVHDAYSFHR